MCAVVVDGKEYPIISVVFVVSEEVDHGLYLPDMDPYSYAWSYIASLLFCVGRFAHIHKRNQK